MFKIFDLPGYFFKYKKISGVYKITIIVNNKIYIGSAVSIYERYYTHIGHLRKGKHRSKHLQSSFNKYG